MAVASLKVTPVAEDAASRARRTDPPVTTVFLGEQGELRHARCREQMAFQGTRGGLEIDYYCLACHEHVTLSAYALSRVTVGA
jgi:hypothetical protein